MIDLSFEEYKETLEEAKVPDNFSKEYLFL